MKKPKISIIIPVYNVEEYLERCLNSIRNQSYDNLEVIMIDDCSTDNSYEICQKYEEKYNFKLLKNNDNKGLSYTRNRGIKESTGDYIGFIDSDDYVDSNYYESLLKNIKENDICVCDISLEYKDHSIREQCGNENGQKKDFLDCGLVASACNKLFKANLFKNNLFEVGKINEDVQVIIPLILNNSISYSSETCYHYVQRENSIQSNSVNDKKLDIIHAVDETLKKIETINDYNLYSEIIIFQQLTAFLMFVPEKDNNFFNRYSFLKKYRKQCKYKLSKNNYFKEKIKKYGKFGSIYYKCLISLFDAKLIVIMNLLISIKKAYSQNKKSIIQSNITVEELLKRAMDNQQLHTEKKVSVVVPNYNYGKFLYERIYSILYQTYKIDELIILDDYSKDNSKEIIENLKKALSNIINLKVIYNTKNSGKAFIQWEKGFNEASNEYVWIAEADDYSDPRFLKEAMDGFDNNTIISYVDTAFINSKGKRILKSVKNQIDIMKTRHWNKSYNNNGENEFNNYAFLNCTIANVSGAVIKKGNYSKGFEEAKKYRQAGDWVFYSYLMHLGNVAYSSKTYNYYRVHETNVSTITKKEDHFKELETIYSYYDKEYKLNTFQKQEIKKRCNFLKKVWDLGDKNDKTVN